MNTAISYHSFTAPAKLNLMLKVVGKRDDGYHLLETIFRLIDLNDTIGIAVREDGEIRLHDPIPGVEPEQDLTVRAARLLKRTTQSPLGVDIHVRKRIPMGGGLGGGSSDAATVLIALNRLWNTGLSREKLMELGLTLGADVPFFVFGRNAFATGIGEQLSEMTLPERWYVVVHPGVHVPTAKVFSSPLLTRHSSPGIMPILETTQRFENELQGVVCKMFPAVSEALDELKKFGSPLMTGSGSCVFLECGSENEAKQVNRVVSKRFDSFVAKGLDCHPLIDMI
jgi:4-diphosphocytidyl-2-C-methyl-D-erythritol kinase